MLRIPTKYDRAQKKTNAYPQEVPKMSILELFCSVDDFWQQFAPNWHHTLLTSGQRKRLRPTQLHQSHYRTFKVYYTEYVQCHLRSEFPALVSYQRFVELMPTVLIPLVAYLHTHLVLQL
jgi:hypothetical protein